MLMRRRRAQMLMAMRRMKVRMRMKLRMRMKRRMRMMKLVEEKYEAVKGQSI